MTFRRYEPRGTLRLPRPRKAAAGVMKESVPKEVAVALEFLRDRARSVRVTVYPDEVEASDIDSSSAWVARRVESKNSSSEGRLIVGWGGGVSARGGRGEGNGDWSVGRASVMVISAPSRSHVASGGGW